jgi:hypothetical protein
VEKEVHFTYKLDRNQSNWLVSFRLCSKKVKDLFCVVILSPFFLLCMMINSLRMWTEYSSGIIYVYIQYCGVHFCRRKFSVNSSIAGWKLCFFLSLLISDYHCGCLSATSLFYWGQVSLMIL